MYPLFFASTASARRRCTAHNDRNGAVSFALSAAHSDTTKVSLILQACLPWMFLWCRWEMPVWQENIRWSHTVKVVCGNARANTRREETYTTFKPLYVECASVCLFVCLMVPSRVDHHMFSTSHPVLAISTLGTGEGPEIEKFSFLYPLVVEGEPSFTSSVRYCTPMYVRRHWEVR